MTVAIRNTADSARICDRPFRFETGATNCLVARHHPEAMGLAPMEQRVCVLADGGEIRMNITVAQTKFMGEFIWSTIVFDGQDSEPILSWTAIELAGVEMDSRDQTFNRLPAVWLKEIQGRHLQPKYD